MMITEARIKIPGCVDCYNWLFLQSNRRVSQAPVVEGWLVRQCEHTIIPSDRFLFSVNEYLMNMNVIWNGVNIFLHLLCAIGDRNVENRLVLCNCSVRKIKALDELLCIILVNFWEKQKKFLFLRHTNKNTLML